MGALPSWVSINDWYWLQRYFFVFQLEAIIGYSDNNDVKNNQGELYTLARKRKMVRRDSRWNFVTQVFHNLASDAQVGWYFKDIDLVLIMDGCFNLYFPGLGSQLIVPHARGRSTGDFQIKKLFDENINKGVSWFWLGILLVADQKKICRRWLSCSLSTPLVASYSTFPPRVIARDQTFQKRWFLIVTGCPASGQRLVDC